MASRVVASPRSLMVCWALRIVAVGLKATRSTMVSPLLMPHWMPPELLVAVRRLPSPVARKASLCSLPRCRVPAKPEPI